MFIRHFGYSVGHLQYEQQHKIEPDTSMALEDYKDISDSLDNNDTKDTDSQNRHDEVAVESEDLEEDKLYNGKVVDDDEGEWEGNVVDTISDSGGSNSDGYASF